MKKLISLLLALLLCLGSLPCALAEEAAETVRPDPNLPITLEAYQAAYNAILADVVPDVPLSWTEEAMGDQTVYAALFNNATYSVLVLPKDGVVSELAVMYQGDMSETAILDFVYYSTFCGAALLVDEEVSTEEAFNAFFTEFLTVFSNMLNSIQSDSIYGLNGAISINPASEEVYQYYFVLDLNEAAAE